MNNEAFYLLLVSMGLSDKTFVRLRELLDQLMEQLEKVRQMNL